MALLNEAQITAGLATLSGWAHRDNALQKQFTFQSFPDAIAFLVRLAFAAEAADHHPDIVIDYRRLTLRYWTHSEGGVTQKDLAGARAAEQLFPAR